MHAGIDQVLDDKRHEKPSGSSALTNPAANPRAIGPGAALLGLNDSTNNPRECLVYRLAARRQTPGSG